jgi:putative transposase
MSENGIDSSYEISSEIWTRIVPLLLPQTTKNNKKKTGRPTEWITAEKRLQQSSLCLTYGGCQWKALPRALGGSSTVHDRFQEWGEEIWCIEENMD